ncbi:MAG: helix-turn-helix transcriptional regulator [Solibacillus sp.]
MARGYVNIELLKELRIQKGLSVEEMSKLMGFESYQGYYYKESGARKMGADDVAKAAEILEVPIQKLFFEKIVTEMVTIVA